MALAVKFECSDEECLRKPANGGKSLAKVVFVCGLIDTHVLSLRM